MATTLSGLPDRSAAAGSDFIDDADADDEQLYDNHVLSVCSALGGFVEAPDGSGPVYIPGDECLACLRDLKRFLRSAERDKDRHIHNLLCKWRVLETDLLPLLVTSVRNNNLKTAIAVCELLVPLTWPFDANDNLAYQDVLKQYQQAFLQDGVLSSIMAILIHLFAVPPARRDEKDQARLRLFLSLFRNILAVSDSQVSVTTASAESQWNSSLQERLIVRMHADGVTELLLSLCGSLGESQFEAWNTLLIEIFNLMFDRRDIAHLFAQNQKSEHLAELLKREQLQKSLSSRPRSSRHPRFGGTFEVMLPGGSIINTRKVSKAAVLPESLDRPEPPKPRRAKKDLLPNVPIGDPEAKAALLEIATQFINNCFNDLALSMKRDFDRERTFVKAPHYLQYTRLCHFALSFRQHANRAGQPINIESVLSIMNIPNIVFVLRRINNSRDDKNPIETTVCLRLLDEMLLTTEELLDSSDDDLSDIGSQLVSMLFYEYENTVSLRAMCKELRVHTKSYLEALVSCVDTLLELTERVTKKQGMIITRKRAKAARSKPKKTAASRSGDVDGDSAVQDDYMYDDDDMDYDQPRFVEKEFDVQAFMEGFASEATIITYCQLMSYYPELSSETMHRILRMFMRLVKNYDCIDAFFRLSTLNLLYSVLTRSRQSAAPRESWHKDLQTFVADIVRELVSRVQVSSQALSDQVGLGPLELVKLLFGSMRTEDELARIQEYDTDTETFVYRGNIGDSMVCRMISEFWLTTTIHLEHRQSFFGELCDVLNTLLARMEESSAGSLLTEKAPETVALSPDAIRLLTTSDEVQVLFDACGLTMDGTGSVVIPSQWTANEISDVIKTIMYLRTRKPKRRTTTKRRTTLRKRKKPEKETVALSAQFVEDSDDNGNDDSFFEREAERRRLNDNQWKKVTEVAAKDAALGGGSDKDARDYVDEDDSDASDSSAKKKMTTKRKNRNPFAIFSDSESSDEDVHDADDQDRLSRSDEELPQFSAAASDVMAEIGAQDDQHDESE